MKKVVLGELEDPDAVSGADVRGDEFATVGNERVAGQLVRRNHKRVDVISRHLRNRRCGVDRFELTRGAKKEGLGSVKESISTSVWWERLS